MTPPTMEDTIRSQANQHSVFALDTPVNPPEWPTHAVLAAAASSRANQLDVTCHALLYFPVGRRFQGVNIGAALPPRLRRSVRTLIQNFAPSPPVPGHSPSTSFSPLSVTPIAA